MSSSCPPKRAEGQRELHVIESYRLTENIRRVILGGEELVDLDMDASLIGPHLKLFIPPANAACLLWPEYDALKGRLVWPEQGERPTVRTYSLRDYDAQLHQLTIDLVCHDGGVASEWAKQAKAGDKIGIWGPGARLSYRDQWLVLAGDISALPAIGYTLEQVLPANAKGKAIIEVPSKADLLPLRGPAGMEIIWLVRHPDQESKLIDAVASVQIPDGFSPLIWGGMECDLAKGLRRAIKDKMKLQRDEYYLVNYWRKGVPEGGFNHSVDE
ncbi:siderophore-interacting protein [Limnobaculum parvum]|uniref:Siderophore-interacting protein n=1 Tax=Limnobaculum parvum TaxID=2172103 RepID=A0A2Y9TXS2_9GAMM|nr:siderophore-interacting protein [Limnobaculum parvum]AWH88341.1 siderophore-interacting protein [Limnobaculum parvum]